MRNGWICAICLCCLSAPLTVAAQDATSTSESSQQPPTPTAAASPLVAPASNSFWAPFAQTPKDFVNFFSKDTAIILGVGSAAFMVAHRWDDDWERMAIDRLKPGAFTAGNVWGGLYSQLGTAFAVYSLGKATGDEKVSEFGSDLLRAQILTQGVVQAMKFSFQRWRPDGSNRLSLPSGHTAGAVATATVLQRHYGWKLGVPAYTVSAYVAASRMSANKHHLTDVMLGAAVGLAAGRTTTIAVAKQRFSVGVAPTVGGAAVTVTKQ